MKVTEIYNNDKGCDLYKMNVIELKSLSECYLLEFSIGQVYACFSYDLAG